MSVLFDALKRAQQSVLGNQPGEPQHAALHVQPPAGSVTDPGGVNAARSILSATARRPAHRRVWPLLTGGLLALIVGGTGGWYYLKSQIVIHPVKAPPNIHAAPAPAPAQAARQIPANAAAPEAALTPAPAPVTVQREVLPKPAFAKRTRRAVSRHSATPEEAKPAAAVAEKPAAPAAENPPAVQMLASADLLNEAYIALSENRLADAETKYLAVIAERPHEKDALLGLAVVAQRQKQSGRALDYYQQVLSEDPNNIVAATALFALSEQADPAAAESRLKQLLELKPAAPEPYYALGNVLARQHRWGEAQQAFFRAYSLKPDALYAFNLAVALDHLQKTASALAYYEKASQLAKPGDSTINRDAIQQRMQELNNAALVSHSQP